MHCRTFVISFALLSTVTTSFAQQDPLALDSLPAEGVPVTQAFNHNYIINNQSTNVLERGRLNFLILHRFGELSDGSFNAYGLDYAAVRFGFEYGISDRLTAGIGRSSVGKNYDSHLKYRVRIQKDNGSNKFPISVVAFSSIAFSAVELQRQNAIHSSDQLGSQLVYVSELIISRQFSDFFSFELIPAIVHRNAVPSATDDNNLYALSAGGRLRLTSRMHFMFDYGYVQNIDHSSFANPIAAGLDIVTGGHVFQVYLTNSVGMIEKEFLTATTGRIQNGNLRIGFTISRSFVTTHKVKGGKLK